MNSIVVRTWNGKESLAMQGEVFVLNRLNKERVIPFSQVLSFEIEDPKGKMRPGTITLRIAGTASLEDMVSSWLNSAGGSGITFNHGIDYLEAAHEMQRAFIASSQKQPAPADDKKVVSVVDEIRGLKALLDEGILTQEEFDAKKKQLLGI